ncbi:VIT domain-containing protein [Planctomicrobium piriforme]|uniref:Ca-activated chloride channel family protein n=1 Tax=Planctomicrobium piriforme TaxID=1576369 RepID=A0A1I3ILY8_9PLAN|nr:VIT domain-containing protein [Planctomicrobium piriforme]SFI48988.1 Ca-activated chloride channel family protein [Planctomicrobium piriforme]
MLRCACPLVLLLLFPMTLWGQGVLVDVREPVPLPRPLPQPPQVPRISYGVDELRVDARVRDQIADVQVSQTFRNTGSQTLEAQFLFPLPYDGAIDSLTLMVNGKEFPAQLLKAEDARQRYESIVRRNRDPALLQWIGTGLFQTNVFPIPAGEQRTVTLHYSQLLRKTDGLTDFLFPLATARYSSQPVGKISLRIAIENTVEIKNLYSPSHAVSIERNGPRQAVVKYEAQHVVPSEDFRLFIDSQAGAVGATVLSYHPEGTEDGYFLLLASPQFQTPQTDRIAKTVSFIVDKSGSMSGEKMEQTRSAARFLLNQLAENDLFNIVSFDSQVQSYRPELELMNTAARTQASAYFDGLNAGGGTNIHDALVQGLSQLRDRQRPAYVLFLTDGLPTAGETNEARITQAAKAANQAGARLLVFGVGYDVNSRLLDRLSREQHGLSEYVRPNENIEAAISRVFQRISRPVLTGVQINYELDAPGGAQVNRVYPGGELDLFAGEQLVVVGRYKNSGDVRIQLKGMVNGGEQRHEFNGHFAAAGRDSTNAFIARLWAMRRIGELIDELDLNGRNPELIEELVRLSTAHGIMTPYTAFLADDTVRPELSSTSNQLRASENLGQLDVADGATGFAQREAKQNFKYLGLAPAGAAPVMNPEAERNLPVELRTRATDPATGKAAIVQKGDQTLYRRGKLLMTPQTAGLDLDKDRSQLTAIKRFSAEYFDLVAKNSKAENELLSEQSDDEELLVQLRGVNYLIQ